MLSTKQGNHWYHSFKCLWYWWIVRNTYKHFYIWQYDNGGPLMCSEVLAGVVSWGDSNCNTNGTISLASVCARTGYFYNWINTNCNCL